MHLTHKSLLVLAWCSIFSSINVIATTNTTTAAESKGVISSTLKSISPELILQVLETIKQGLDQDGSPVTKSCLSLITVLLGVLVIAKVWKRKRELLHRSGST